jgi:hypothetical protein
VSGRMFILFVCCAIVLSAAATPVGVLTTVGSIRLDGADVRGNGTVLNGSIVETAANPSQLSLKNGIHFDLAAQSRAQVYDNHAILERGASQIHGSNGYPIQVNAVSVIPIGDSSTIRVFRTSASKLQVSAVTGQAEVHNADGLLIAKVFPGSALDFDQQPAGAVGAAKVSGKLEKTDTRYMLTDVTTKTNFELQGDNLDKSVGHCIAATGSADPANATLLHVATYDEVSCKKLGLAAGGGAAAGGVAAGGLSHAAIAGIVIGGVAAGSIGGAAAAGAFSGGNAKSASAP